MRLSEAIDIFLLTCDNEGKSLPTQDGYKSALKLFLSAIGDEDVQELNVNHLDKFVASEKRRLVHGHVPSMQTVKKRYAVVRTFIRWMYRRKMIFEKFTDLANPPKPGKPLPAILSDEQLKALMHQLRKENNFRNLVIFEVFLDTGCRLEEVSRIDVKDINFDQRYIRILGKGNKEDIVPFGSRVAIDLHTYLLQHHHPRDGETALFLNEQGTRLRRAGIKIMVRRELELLGLKRKVGAHILRHTFATNYLRQGGRIEELQLILRHTRVETTQIYTHLNAADILAAHRKASPMDKMRL